MPNLSRTHIFVPDRYGVPTNSVPVEMSIVKLGMTIRLQSTKMAFPDILLRLLSPYPIVRRLLYMFRLATYVNDRDVSKQHDPCTAYKVLKTRY